MAAAASCTHQRPSAKPGHSSTRPRPARRSEPPGSGSASSASASAAASAGSRGVTSVAGSAAIDGGDRERVGLAVRRPPAGEEPRRRQLGGIVGRRAVAPQPAQHRVDQRLEAARPMAASARATLESTAA